VTGEPEPASGILGGDGGKGWAELGLEGGWGSRRLRSSGHRAGCMPSFGRTGTGPAGQPSVDPALVGEDQAPGIDLGQLGAPNHALLDGVGPIPLRHAEGSSRTGPGLRGARRGVGPPAREPVRSAGRSAHPASVGVFASPPSLAARPGRHRPAAAPGRPVAAWPRADPRPAPAAASGKACPCPPRTGRRAAPGSGRRADRPAAPVASGPSPHLHQPCRPPYRVPAHGDHAGRVTRPWARAKRQTGTGKRLPERGWDHGVWRSVGAGSRQVRSPRSDGVEPENPPRRQSRPLAPLGICCINRRHHRM
jgi:hypothetical protein